MPNDTVNKLSYAELGITLLYTTIGNNDTKICNMEQIMVANRAALRCLRFPLRDDFIQSLLFAMKKIPTGAHKI